MFRSKFWFSMVCEIFVSIGLEATCPAQLQSVLMAALSTLWVGLFPSIVASDAVGGAATGRSGQLAVGGSAECRDCSRAWN